MKTCRFIGGRRNIGFHCKFKEHGRPNFVELTIFMTGIHHFFFLEDSATALGYRPLAALTVTTLLPGGRSTQSQDGVRVVHHRRHNLPIFLGFAESVCLAKLLKLTSVCLVSHAADAH
jgi:hypothetical protein